MAYNEKLELATATAGADLSTDKHHLIALAADGQVDPAGAGVEVLGVLHQVADAAGKTVSYAMPGSITKVVSGAAVTVGDVVMSNASGRAITATATNKGVGIALSTSAADGELITIQLMTLGTQ